MSATKPLWSIVPDGPLFAVPFAALPVRAADAYSRYLIEDHAVRTLPSVLLPPSGAEEIEGGFVAVGDPVYNRADSRWRGSAQPGLQLPRLAASGVEAENVARAWPAQTEVLRGAAATRTRFLATLARRPAILHLALHFVESEDRRQTFLALGRGPDSQQSERLGPETIRTLTGAPALVVMNGCESGRGPVLSGAGLMGLTRAWLAAGAREVAASHWPVRDDSGEIFVRLYHHLQTPSGATASLALRQAQLEMIRAADWRREPRYWSAFFVVSKG